MIVPDINLLVYAHNEASRFHAPSKRWWERVLNEPEPIGLCWATVMGFIRIVTHPGIQTDPISVEEAVARVDAWLLQPQVQWLHPGSRHYPIFRRMLLAAGSGGNLTTDAHLAALAIEHQSEMYSNDTDFARFPGLKWVNPLARRMDH
jgi:uncharacterized protein